MNFAVFIKKAPLIFLPDWGGRGLELEHTPHTTIFKILTRTSPVHMKSKKVHGKGHSVSRFLSMEDFSNLLRTEKGKMKAKYGGGIKSPISRTLENVTSKGTGRRSSQRS